VTPHEYAQSYDEGSGDAITQPHHDDPALHWWWCEHEGDHHTVLSGRLSERVDCTDCGTGWIIWPYAGRVLAKAVVMHVGGRA